jgi:ABC-type cobalt transport system substrate-binding protein
MSRILVIVALVLALIAAVLSFGWFGADPEAGDVLGILALSLVAYFASLLAPN